MEETRSKIKEIETRIASITGSSLDPWNHWVKDKSNCETVEELLLDRCKLLNSMFIPSSENMSRFKRVNDHLYTMTQKLHSRIAGINAQSDTIADEHVFDDDEVVEGWLRVVFDDESSVLRLDDDSYYGSNFPLMIKLLIALYDEKCLSEVEYVCNGMTALDDGTSWMDAPFWNWPEFNDIIICHAVHDLTNHKAFSIPDLLRLNDFWCEAQIKFQSITRQDGTRCRQYAQ